MKLRMKHYKALCFSLILMISTPLSAVAASTHPVPTDGTDYTEIIHSEMHTVGVGGAKKATE